MPWRLRPTARKRRRTSRYGDTWRLQALRQLRPRSAGAQLGAMTRVPQAQQMGAQAGAQVVAVAWSGSGPGGFPVGPLPPLRGAPARAVPPPRWSGGRNIKGVLGLGPPPPRRPAAGPWPGGPPRPRACSRPAGRPLASGGGRCGGLGPPPGPRGPSGGRCGLSAARLRPSARPPGSPGGPRCGVGGPGPRRLSARRGPRCPPRRVLPPGSCRLLPPGGGAALLPPGGCAPALVAPVPPPGGPVGRPRWSRWAAAPPPRGGAAGRLRRPFSPRRPPALGGVGARPAWARGQTAPRVSRVKTSGRAALDPLGPARQRGGHTARPGPPGKTGRKSS